MGFLMAGLDAEAYDRSYKDSQLLRRISRYFWPQYGVMAAVTVLIVLGALLNIAYPILLARTIDTLVASPIWRTTLVLIALILLTSALAWGCNVLHQWFTARAVGNLVLQLRKDAFAAVMAQDLSFFDQFASGKIVSRVTSDTESFATVVTLTLQLLSQSLVFLFVVTVLFVRNWHLALLTMTILPAVVIVTLGFRYLARRATRRSQRSLARVNTNVHEAVSGITVAKNFRQEQAMYAEFQRVNEQSYYVNLRLNFLYSSVYPVLAMIANIGTAIVVYFGGQSVLQRNISAGDWFLFVQSIGLLWPP